MATRPRIIISETDLDRLERLIESHAGNDVTGLAELEAELERAEVVPSKDVPPNVVTMNSKVRFRDALSSDTFEMILVYPRDVDVSGGTISILAPVGSAMLGLAEGDEIEWPRPGGGNLRVRIEKVIYQPERAGEHHR